jgi:hypothetical protein
VREAKLTKEQTCGLYSFDERDLPAELEELHTCVVGVQEERAAEAGELAALVTSQPPRAWRSLLLIAT